MFTWICPKCGGEVSPSYSECPRCNPRKSEEQAEDQLRAAEPEPTSPPILAPVQAPISPPAQTRTQAPTQTTPQAPMPRATSAATPLAVGQLSYAAEQSPPPDPPYYSPPQQQARARSLSPFLVAAGAAVGIITLLAILYIYVLPHSGETAGVVPANLPAIERPAPGGLAARGAHPLAKHLEVGGVRLQESAGGKVRIDFVVVNHSAADLPKLKMEVRLQSGGRDYFIIPVDLPSIGPFESKDLSTSVTTTLKPYELPDWQLLRPVFTLQD